MFTITAGDQPPTTAETASQAAETLGEILMATLTSSRTRAGWRIEDEAGLVLLGEIGLGQRDPPHDTETIRAAVDTITEETHQLLAALPDPTAHTPPAWPRSGRS